MKPGKKMKVTIAYAGNEPEKLTLKPGTTVEEALEKADVSIGEKDRLYVNGERADDVDELEDGDFVSVTGPKEGGR